MVAVADRLLISGVRSAPSRSSVIRPSAPASAPAPARSRPRRPLVLTALPGRPRRRPVPPGGARDSWRGRHRRHRRQYPPAPAPPRSAAYDPWAYSRRHGDRRSGTSSASFPPRPSPTPPAAGEWPWSGAMGSFSGGRPLRRPDTTPATAAAESPALTPARFREGS